jgi:hypothetical protein
MPAFSFRAICVVLVSVACGFSFMSNAAAGGIVYSGYLGGMYDDVAFGVAVDGDGNAYITGTTGSPNFPETVGTNGIPYGSQAPFVAKFSPVGALLYCTIIGGVCDGQSYAIAVDGAGNAYITGRANTCILGPGSPPGVLVAKLNPIGGLTYLYVFGASFGDSSAGYAIAIDNGGYAYVTGQADGWSLDFPTTPGAFQTNPCGGYPSGDGFVAKVNPAGTGLVYSTYICGTMEDTSRAIAIDPAGFACIAGDTMSQDFPMVNAFQTNGPGTVLAGFVCKLDPGGSNLVYSTYFGGPLGDTLVEALALDTEGNAYVTGDTSGGSLPTTSGAVQAIPPSPVCAPNFCHDAFVAKFSPAGSLVYSTYLAGEGDDAGAGIAVDANGNAYIAGSTASLYFPIRNAFQVDYRGPGDAFVTKLNPQGSRILFSSYLGGGQVTNSTLATDGQDEADGIALGADGKIYLAGHTTSLDFPTTAGVFQPTAPTNACSTYQTCGNAFVTCVTADGTGITPAVSLTVSPEVLVGGTVTAAWSGIPSPTTNDQLQLFRLGDSGHGPFILTNYNTTGAAAGTLPLPLPPTLPPGSYDFRLLGTDPDFPALLKVIARREPVTVLPPPRFFVSIEKPAHILHVVVEGLPTGTYNVQATDNLAPAVWQSIGSLVSTNGSPAGFTDPISFARTTRFYRLTTGS